MIQRRYSTDDNSDASNEQQPITTLGQDLGNSIPGAFRLYTPAQLRAMPRPEPLIDDLLYRSTLAVLSGQPSRFKSFIALSMGLSLASGQPWYGHKVHPGPVLYISMEGAAGLQQRIGAWEQAQGRAAPDNFLALPQPVKLVSPSDDRERLLRTVDRLEVPPVLIVVDTLARAMTGSDENAPKDMGLLVESADELRRATGATVLIIGHVDKSRGLLRGHGALLGALDAEIKAERKDGSDIVTLRCGKQKDATEFAPIMLRRRVVALTDGASSMVLDLVPPGEPSARPHLLVGTPARLTPKEKQAVAVLEAMAAGASREDWAAACRQANMKKSTVHAVIGKLIDQGAVLMDDAGRCRVPGESDAA